MELTKSQKALLAIPSKWQPILLGITLSIFISVIFTSSFVSRIMPASLTSPGSSSSAPFSLWAPGPSSSIPTFYNRFFIILFRNYYSHGAPTENNASSHSTLPAPEMSAQAHVVSDTTSVGLSSSTELNKDHGDDVEANKNAELVQQKELFPSQAALPPLTKPVDAVGLLGRKSLLNSTYARNETEPLMKNGTLSSNGSKSSMEELQSDGRKATLPGYTNTINSTNKQPPASSQDSRNAQICDISIGKWIKDDLYPLYHPGTCPFVDEAFSCQSNGRPDSKYNRWRWAPRDCIVPRFNGTDLLERLRWKRLVFVGDSLNRNQWESMLCMLRESLPDKNRIVQIHGGRISKIPGAYAFKFLDYECKVEFYTSQYLVHKEGEDLTQFTIRLDRMDMLEKRWRRANVLIFNTGHWWTSDKIGEGDHRFQEGSTVYPKLDIDVAFNKALSTWAKWVDKYVNLQTTTVFFRGYSPVHYIGGQWNSGGQCQDETEPIFDESLLTPYPSKMQVLEGVLREMKHPVQLLNITRLSEYRKDAHPATYGHAIHHAVEHQDCSHWCLPGLPDAWNELLYFVLTKQLPTTS